MADEENNNSENKSSEESTENAINNAQTSEAAGSAMHGMHKLQVLAQENLEYFQNKKQMLSNTFSENSEKYLPGPLPKTQTAMEDVKQRLLSIMLQGEEEEEEQTAIIYSRPGGLVLDDIQNVCLISHTTTAFVSMLDENLVRRIALKIFSETTLWIDRLFRFYDFSAYFHRDTHEGLIRVIKLALHSRYPKYLTHGYEALYTRPPVIYYNEAQCPGLAQHICSELGLPVTCMASIPSKDNNSSSFQMDATLLKKRILEDSATTKTPLLVIAGAGSPLFGNSESFAELREFCPANNVWIHANGHALAALCMESAKQTQNMSVNFADSVTLCLGKWIGLPTLPAITLYKTQDPSIVHAAGIGNSGHTQLDLALPLWITFQALGQESIVQRIKYCFELSDYLLQKINAFPEFRIVNKKSIMPERLEDHNSLSTNPAVNFPKSFEISPCVILFQYVPSTLLDNESSMQVEQRNPPYYDNLNSWLLQILARNIQSVKTDILDFDTYGLCLRICLLESAFVMNTANEDIDNYCECLKNQLTILNSTVKQRELLYEKYTDFHKIQLIEIKDWAGMGGVRYIPEIYVNQLDQLTDTAKEEIDDLNSELVAKLRASDSAFSVGEADDGMLCVRFGMVDEDLNLTELMNLVMAAGMEIEQSSKMLESMSEMVKQGIEEATKELMLENEEKLMQEGFLKQVPVIGSLVSWWYPKDDGTGIKGRSFDLSSGTIESTENIYKYHMQVKEGGPQLPTSKILLNPTALNTSQNTPPHVTQENCVLPNEK